MEENPKVSGGNDVIEGGHISTNICCQFMTERIPLYVHPCGGAVLVTDQTRPELLDSSHLEGDLLPHLRRSGQQRHGAVVPFLNAFFSVLQTDMQEDEMLFVSFLLTFFLTSPGPC